VLAQARGTLVTKEAIIRQVWPSTIVEESNLRFQMACVRKALGRDRDLIKTIPGRGYLLAADVDESSAHPAPLDAARDVRPWDIARPPIWSDLVPGHIEDAGKPTIVLLRRRRTDAGASSGSASAGRSAGPAFWIGQRLPERHSGLGLSEGIGPSRSQDSRTWKL
jgi:hypothetical protein